MILALTGEPSDYSVLSEFGDSLSCDMMAGGVFLVWWDDQGHRAQVSRPSGPAVPGEPYEPPLLHRDRMKVVPEIVRQEH